MVVAEIKYANCGKELVHNHILANGGTPVDVSECHSSHLCAVGMTCHVIRINLRR